MGAVAPKAGGDNVRIRSSGCVFSREQVRFSIQRVGLPGCGRVPEGLGFVV